MEQIQELIEAFKYNKTLILLTSISAFVAYWFIYREILGDSSKIYYASYQAFKYISAIPIVFLGYINFRIAKLDKIRTVIMAVLLSSLMIIIFDFIEFFKHNNDQTIAEMSLEIIFGSGIRIVRVLIIALIGAVLAKISEKREETEQGIFKKSLLEAIWATVIATFICIVSYQTKTYFWFVLANPILVFFDPDFIGAILGLIPVTFIYYGIFMIIMNLAVNRRQRSEKIGEKLLYSVPIFLLYIGHLGLAFLGMLMIELGGS